MPVDPMMKRLEGHLSLFIEKKCAQSLTIRKQSLKHFFMKNLLMCFFFFLITHLLKDQNYEMCFQFSCFLFFH